jgi:DNA-binding NarL/FixJ family response regulator
MLLSPRWLKAKEHFQLSSAETQVANLLFGGSTRREISKKLQRAPGTIRVFIDRLYRKLGVRDRLSFVVCLLTFWSTSSSTPELSAQT